MPLALWAALPAVQWCPVAWQQACTPGGMECPPPAHMPVACSMAPVDCPAMNPTIRCDGDDRGGCGTAAACPMAAQQVHPVAGSTPAPPHRVLCVRGPNGGVSLAAYSVQLEPGFVLVLPASPATVEVDLRLATRYSEAGDEWPPPGAPSRLPPARAPPLARG